MKKILKWYDENILKLGIGFLIIFTALYPKLPSVHIIRTWVYIRLEDFFILGITVLWAIQLLRRKVKLPFAQSAPVFLYWFAGLASLIFCLIFIGPTLTNFFPHIAALNYLRRIEYMVLFLVAITSVRSAKDVRDYIIVLALTTLGVVLYGFGQRYYLNFWAAFPAFFEKYSFCFPSFQTGNEEFAKGIPLCLEPGARLTSTFGGHYDLAAYLVLVIPIILLFSLSVKKKWMRILASLLFLGNLILLIFTASRVSFISYLIASTAALIFYKKKLYIIPVLIISAILLVVFSGSTASRLMATARLSSVVTNVQGQLIGEAPANLSQDLKNKIANNQEIVEKPPSSKTLPLGSGYIGLPQSSTPIATNTAVVSKTLSPEEIKRLNIQSGSLKLSTVSGNFVVKKVLVYDISFTTRFQGEWPNAWRAFLRNPFFGSGYSTITLATDNDYFRALGETGLLGLLSFLFIFLMFGITVRQITPRIDDNMTKGLAYGAAGGAIGLMINATLIDVFEASKVAENLWILMGVAVGGLLVLKKHQPAYVQILKKIFSSKFFISLYILAFVLSVYVGTTGNFFIDKDFGWLKYAAGSSIDDLVGYFTSSGNLLYLPFVKSIIFFLYTFFSFQPEGYHVFIIILNFFGILGFYILAAKIFKSKLIGFLMALIFGLLPFNAGNMFWLSDLGATLSSVLMIYTFIFFYRFRERASWVAYGLALVFAALSFMSYQSFLILPIAMILADKFYLRKIKGHKSLVVHWPFVVLFAVYFVVINFTNSIIDLRSFGLDYLAWAFLLIMFFVFVSGWSEKITGKKTVKNWLFLVIAIVILVLSLGKNFVDARSYHAAGEIAKNLLTDIKVSYENLNPADSIYFVNLPESYNGIPVFGDGLRESLWFIYQQNTPKIFKEQSVDEAKSKAEMQKSGRSYIFVVDEKGSIKSVK